MTDRTSNEAGNNAANLAAANRTGQWMAWTGFALALLWWGAGVGGLVGLVGVEALGQQPVALVTAVGIMVLLPGLMMVTAGLMARQSRRTSAANAIILAAADELLAPAQTAETGIATLAAETRKSTDAINTLVAEALASLTEMTTALSEERLRAESVTYAMADNARDLTQRLTNERLALQDLAKSLQAQTETMTEAIPRQAQAMATAAKQAGEEVGAADVALEKRLHQLKHAGSTLAVRLSDLEAVAKDAASRTEALNLSVARIEDKLGQSQKTVEMAERASAMAVDAATTTGNALKDAVSAALDGARRANAEIAQTTRKVQEDAAHTLAELREASLAAGQAATSAGDIARRELGERGMANGTSLATGSAKTAVNGNADHSKPTLDRSPSLRGRSTDKPPLPPPSAPTAGDADLFDGPQETSQAANPDEIVLRDRTDAPIILNTPEEVAPAQRKKRSSNGNGASSADGDTEWRNLLADIDETAAVEVLTRCR